MGKLSIQSRKSVVADWLTNKDVSGAASRHSVAYNTAKLWIEKHLKVRGCKDEARSGRPPLISKEAAERALELIDSEQRGGVRSVANIVHSEGLTSRVFNRTTMARAIKKEAKVQGITLRARMGKPDKRLNPDTVAARLAFCSAKANKRRAWSLVMFTDRTKFHHRYPGEKVHAVSYHRQGERRQARKVNHAACINMYLGITMFGITSPHVVAAGSTGMTTKYKNKKGFMARNITSDEYKDVLRGTFLSKGTCIFSKQGIAHWVLQQDNDPTHNVAHEVIRDWNTKHPGSTVTLLPEWPPNSPDLNPIENLWSIIQAKLDAAGYKTFEEFKAGVFQEVANVDKGLLRSLVKSMVKRMKECVGVNGGKTKH
jgi:transposase